MTVFSHVGTAVSGRLPGFFAGTSYHLGYWVIGFGLRCNTFKPIGSAATAFHSFSSPTANYFPLRVSIRPRRHLTMRKRPASSHVEEKPAMRKRPASSHVEKKPDADHSCWSCVAGGFGGFASRAQNGHDFQGCCRSCKSDRTCCRKFNKSTHLPWCSQCQQYLALWCTKCTTPSDLEHQLCSRCSAKRVAGDIDGQPVTYRRADGKCWSCVAGEFGKYCNKAKTDEKYRGCCRSCFSHRMCCGVFNQSLELPWCKQCGCYPATWHCEKNVRCRTCKTVADNAAGAMEDDDNCPKRQRKVLVSKTNGNRCGRACECGRLSEATVPRCVHPRCFRDALWCTACEDAATLAKNSCRIHAVPVDVCACGSNEKTMLTRCVHCHRSQAATCEKCKTAGFLRFACARCLAGGKAPEAHFPLDNAHCTNYPMKVKCDGRRQRFELDSMMSEDPDGLRVRQCVARRLYTDGLISETQMKIGVENMGERKHSHINFLSPF